MARRRVKLKKEDKEKIVKLLENGEIRTDSDIMDYCDEHNLAYGPVDHFISELLAPKCCKGCCNVAFYPNMFPCSCCARANQVDYYNVDKDKIDEMINEKAKERLE